MECCSITCKELFMWLPLSITSLPFYLCLNCCPKITLIFRLGPIIDATVWQMAFVENVLVVVLSAVHRVISTIRGDR